MFWESISGKSIGCGVFAEHQSNMGFVENVLFSKINEFHGIKRKSHFGKFQDSVTIKIESPFMQHLKAHEINEDNFMDAEFSIVTDEPIELPPRNYENDEPRARAMDERMRISDIEKKKSPKYKKKLKDIQVRKILVKRAKVVGLEPLPPGRPTESARRKWMRKLERLEKSNREQ